MSSLKSQSIADRRAHEYLAQHNVLCLATALDQQPWVSPVFYALWRGSLIFLSAPHTRHAQNLVSNTRVSGSIQEDYKNWKDIQGIQLEGSVAPVESIERTEVIQCYTEKFPIIGDGAPAELAKAIDKVNWYKLTPSLIYFIDNSRGLGHRDEITFPSS